VKCNKTYTLSLNQDLMVLTHHNAMGKNNKKQLVNESGARVYLSTCNAFLQ